jgi:hypothetical protein
VARLSEIAAATAPAASEGTAPQQLGQIDDIKAVIKSSITSEMASSFTELARSVDELSRMSKELSADAVGAVQSGVSQIARVAKAISGAHSAADTASVMTKEMEQFLMEALREIKADKGDGTEKKPERRTKSTIQKDRTLYNLETFVTVDWRNYIDKFKSLMENISDMKHGSEETSKKIDRIMVKIDRIGRAKKDKASDASSDVGDTQDGVSGDPREGTLKSGENPGKSSAGLRGKKYKRR